MKPMIPFRVQYSHNDNPLALQSVKNLIRKSPRKNTPYAPIIYCVSLGVDFQRAKGVCDFVQELVSQRWALALIPFGGFG